MNTPTDQANLLAWINTHDCGITPCGVANPDGSITVRVEALHADGSVSIESTKVRNIREARAPYNITSEGI